jgi:hypothetical protein
LDVVEAIIKAMAEATAIEVVTGTVTDSALN